MVAEAENEYYGYPTQLAQDCLKEVRERAGVNVDRYIPSLTTQSKFREAIKDERAMELCFEYTRRFDLIRWGEFVERMNEQAEEAQVGNLWNQASQVVQFFRVTNLLLLYTIPQFQRFFPQYQPYP